MPTDPQPETLTAAKIAELREIEAKTLPVLLRWYDGSKSGTAVDLLKILRALPALLDAAEERAEVLNDLERRLGLYGTPITVELHVQDLQERYAAAEQDARDLRRALRGTCEAVGDHDHHTDHTPAECGAAIREAHRKAGREVGATHREWRAAEDRALAAERKARVLRRIEERAGSLAEPSRSAVREWIAGARKQEERSGRGPSLMHSGHEAVQDDD